MRDRRRGSELRNSSPRQAVALIMVLIVLSTLAVIGTPFVISMMIRDRASRSFAGDVATVQAAKAARNHAVARLEQLSYPAEWAREVDRADLEEQRAPRRRGATRLLVGEADRKKAAGEDEEEDSRLTVSARGLPPQDVDALEDMDVALPEFFEWKSQRKLAEGGSGSDHIRFRNSGGITASTTVRDEQGKIHLNTAPPNAIAAVFGVTQLSKSIDPETVEFDVDDTGGFRGDDDPKTIDGGLVLFAPDGRTEVVSYTVKESGGFAGVHRGDFLAGPAQSFPAGTFVYDLRGWKLAFHRFWSPEEGGFHPEKLTEFRSVEGMREIANWQAAGLFLGRAQGSGFTADFLSESGVDPRRLSEIGLDPTLLRGQVDTRYARRDGSFEEAHDVLKSLNVKSGEIDTIRARRGLHVVVELASRLEGASKEEVDRTIQRVLKEIDEEDAADAPEAVESDLASSVNHLEELYRTAGIETILPDELELHRDAFTVNSRIPVRYGESQALIASVSGRTQNPVLQVPRASEFGPGTVVRIESVEFPDLFEFNLVAWGAAPEDGVRLAFPLRRSYSRYSARVRPLQRHPVNANTASRKVLRAVFCGVKSSQRGQIVTPYEADRLAERVISSRPIAGHQAFFKLLKKAQASFIIDKADVKALAINSVQPSSPNLLVSTTGLCFATGDVYTLESRGISRTPAGTEIAQTRLREIIDVSPAGRLNRGLFTQRDFADGVYFLDSSENEEFPERIGRELVQFSGTRSHLVSTAPLLLRRNPLLVPQGDRATLQLLPAETPDPSGRRARFTFREIEHFRDWHEGIELYEDEPLHVDIVVREGSQEPADVRAPRDRKRARRNLTTDLIMIPGGIEFWFRMTEYPSASTRDGLVKIMEAGSDAERNRIALVYDPKNTRLAFRMRGNSQYDPTSPRGRKRSLRQFLEVGGRRRLDLHTWYHVRMLWDGVHAGGAMLFVDGLPLGTGSDSLGGVLAQDLVKPQGIFDRSSNFGITLRQEDIRKFPGRGVVRIGAELFEYDGVQGTSLMVRVQPPRQRPQYSSPAAAMHGAWNRRGSTSAPFHPRGSKVSLWGYSREIRRKIHREGRNPSEFQLADGDTSEMVWGPGGAKVQGELLAWEFPQGYRLVHYIDTSLQRENGQPGGSQNGGQGNGNVPQAGAIIVPMFEHRVELIPPGCRRHNGRMYTASVPGRNAADYFQFKGIVRMRVSSTDGGNGGGTRNLLYRKVPLPQELVTAQQLDTCKVVRGQEQRFGLRIMGVFDPSGFGRAVPGLTGTGQGVGNLRPVNGSTPLQLSLLANTRDLAKLYPSTGVIEMTGSPSPFGGFTSGGGPLSKGHPDDRVEWLRYIYIVDDMFIGRLSNSSNFRGYPARNPGRKMQLDHRGGEPIRLVMELSEGGAGVGDIVSITSSDLDKYEPDSRYVLRSFEHADGRFFVSLVDTDDRGRPVLNGGRPYRHTYFRADNPRLVKFPSQGLPEVSAGGQLTLFGDAEVAIKSPEDLKRPRRSFTRAQGDAFDDEPGATVDEIRLYQPDPRYQPDPTYGPRVKHVLVPLTKGRVRKVLGRSGLVSLTGFLPAGLDISPSNPLDVFVVSISTERGLPTLFGQGLKEGVLRIGGELFYFEDLDGAAGNALATLETRGGVYQPRPQDQVTTEEDPIIIFSPTERERDPYSRSRDNTGIRVATVSGEFPQDGFARIPDRYPERDQFFEIFYFTELTGRAFEKCIRGQFRSPILNIPEAARRGSRIQNITKRIRLLGRGLLGTQRETHVLGDPVTLVPYLSVSPIRGPLSLDGLPVGDPSLFSPGGGYVMIDTTRKKLGGPGFELLPYLGRGNGTLLAPRDERGDLFLRGAFGTTEQPIDGGMFAYDMPFRYYDRFKLEHDSEALAYFQKTFRVPGARWRTLSWRERPWPDGEAPLCEVVVLARFDGAPEWDETPTNEPGGLWVFEREDPMSQREEVFPMDISADELEVRVYFRYEEGAYGEDRDSASDDWKHTPILEALNIEYEKDSVILRHEELPF